MGRLRGKCKFNVNWMNRDKFPQYSEWILRTKDNHRAGCKACDCDFDISNSGVTALNSHATSRSHKTAVKTMQSCNIISSFNK